MIADKAMVTFNYDAIAKRAIDEILDQGRVVVEVRTVESVETFGDEPRAAGFTPTFLYSGGARGARTNRRRQELTATNSSMARADSFGGYSAMKLTLETEMETDGRWLSEVPELHGVMTYGATAIEAMAKAEALAFRVLAERLKNDNATAMPISFSVAAE